MPPAHWKGSEETNIINDKWYYILHMSVDAIEEKYDLLRKQEFGDPSEELAEVSRELIETYEKHELGREEARRTH